MYTKTFKSKTGNAKGYKAIDMKFGPAVKAEVEKVKKEASNVIEQPSKLDQKVQDLMRFINDKDLMEKSMVQVGYDVKKLPLGDLSDATILAGYNILKQIEHVKVSSSSSK